MREGIRPEVAEIEDDGAKPVLQDDFLLFERGGEFDEQTYEEVLRITLDTLDSAGIKYVFMGGFASQNYGRPRWTHDIDIFLSEADAKRALGLLGDAGFQTQETYPDWLYKGLRDGVLVDLIFKSAGDLLFDDEMFERAHVIDWGGMKMRLIPPEDLIVIKAIVAAENVPRHWYDALGIVVGTTLDWDYLLRRASAGAKRVLSLLIYAQANDLIVPNAVIGKLYDAIYK